MDTTSLRKRTAELKAKAQRRALTKIKRKDQQVCGLYIKGEPHYFLMPAEATDAQIGAKAFEIKNGRAMSQQEMVLDRMIEAELQRGQTDAG
jgi:hypothetical protein